MNQIFLPDGRLSKFKLWFSVGCVLVAVIMYLSLSSSSVVSMKHNMDKVYHASAYCCLMFWWLQLFPNTAARSVLALMFILMSGGIEVMQSFHPLRYMDWWDFVANSIGVLIAIFMGFSRLDKLLYKFEKRIGLSDSNAP